MAILGYKNSSLFIGDFGLPDWLKTRGLAGWLDIATDGLETFAKQRIAYEIGCHYADAVSVHLAEGKPECSAQSTALAELGDPKEAALNFEKSHLTESDAKWMKSIEWVAGKPFLSIWALLLDGLPLALAVLIFSYPHGQPRLQVSSEFYAGLFLMSYAGFRPVPRLLCLMTPRRSSLLRRLALCQSTTQAVVFSAFWLIRFMRDRDAFAAFTTIVCLYLYAYACNPGFRVWKKLRRMGNERNDPPPWQTTVS
jgi:hypothetical protein